MSVDEELSEAVVMVIGFGTRNCPKIARKRTTRRLRSSLELHELQIWRREWKHS